MRAVIQANSEGGRRQDLTPGPNLREELSEGDFTWNSMSERCVRLVPVALQSLSELERARLQEVAHSRLVQDYDLGCQITIPRDGQKRKKSLRRKFDSLAKEKSKEKEVLPQAFGIPLSQVISNDRAQKQQQEALAQRKEQCEPGDLVSSLPHLASRRGAKEKELSSSNSSLSSTSETPNESPSLNTPEPAPCSRRRGGLSVDCITDLDDNQSHLLEALQLSLPAEIPGNKKKQSDLKLSLNPIYRQVPRVVEGCCVHLEKYGLQTVGIFRVGSSKKRVRQLRGEYDQGLEIQLDEEHSVHDVAALLKEFLRDMPDPLLTRELYTAFINTMQLDRSDQESSMQLLMYLLPPCNSDTLLRLLEFLATVAAHADDRLSQDGQEITGNKMTPLNLATVFGPNLLHKQKSSDKEFAVQSFARAEESTAIIEVVQRMIATQETLFMVPPDLQNEVLISLLETDPDVVDYLLRRKASQSSGTGVPRTRDSFSLNQRRCSSDSYKASSGEVSPYDNNSPVLPGRLLSLAPDDSGSLSDRFFAVPEHNPLVGQVQDCPSDNSQLPSTDQDTPDESFWGTWDVSLDKGFLDLLISGCHGNVLDSSFCGSTERIGCHQEKLTENIPSPHLPSLRLPNTRPTQGHSSPRPQDHSSPRTQKHSSPRPQDQGSPRPQDHSSPRPQNHSSPRPQDHRSPRPQDHISTRPQDHSRPGDHSSPRPQDHSSPRTQGHGSPRPQDHSSPRPQDHSSPRPQGHSSPRPEGHSSPRPQNHSSPRPQGHSSPRPQNHSSPRPQTEARTNPSPCPPEGKASGAPEWQSERWQIWQLLSADNTDTLPETLV
ncbi:hypothetical protein DPEC_G00138140 [Dallia pectoralis]|uniref:Uncharacterized protein n=1 Tax=Dallia pectoralis TaxID=75939 RepID=A0ACC2GM43_DALPE|nr:hypothetical protein DPEC_G00138140 [Dallia pectoralis]